MAYYLFCYMHTSLLSWCRAVKLTVHRVFLCTMVVRADLSGTVTMTERIRWSELDPRCMYVKES